MNMRATLMVLVLLGALATTAVGVTAQPEDVESAGFTGRLHEVAAADDCGRNAMSEVIEGVSQTRGYCVEQWMGSSDPRFTGTYTRFVNVDEYRDETAVPPGVSLWVSTTIHHVENDEGGWHGEASVAATIDDTRDGGEVAVSPTVIVFTGSGSYEGLTAVVWIRHPAVNSQVRGVIFAGSPPPAPSPAE